MAVLERRLRGLRYEQALRRARQAFVLNDLPRAKAAAREAFRQRRTARSAAVLAGLGIAPSLLRTIHPAKQHLQEWVSRLAARVAAIGGRSRQSRGTSADGEGRPDQRATRLHTADSRARTVRGASTASTPR